MSKKLVKFVTFVAITFLPYAFIVSTSWTAAKAGQPVPFLSWIQGQAIHFGPRVAPFADSVGSAATQAVAGSGSAVQGVSSRGMTPTMLAIILAIVAGALVWLVMRASRPAAKGKAGR